MSKAATPAGLRAFAAVELLARRGFRPRDCIHAATAILHAGGRLVTRDRDFRCLDGESADGLCVTHLDGATKAIAELIMTGDGSRG